MGAVRRGWLGIACASALMCACLAAAGPAAAQMPDASECRAIGPDSSEWQAIGRQFTRMGLALRAKDLDSLSYFYAPDYRLHLPPIDGQSIVLSREDAMQLLRERVASIVDIKLDAVTILSLVSCGERATATILSQSNRSQRVDGTVRRFETALIQDNEMEQGPEGWRLVRTANLRFGAGLVDGKRIEPLKAYDPDAPPWEPYPLAPEPPGRVPPPHDCRPATQESATWQGIGRGYARIADAIRRRDIDALLALYAAEIRTETPDGTVWDREQAIAYARAGIEQVRETRLISNVILAIEDCGDRAVATVLQQWFRTQMFQGQVRTLDTAAVQDEEWVATSDGWKRGSVTNVRRGAWTIDGKRVEPGRPFDPDAPDWEPFPER